jgi:glucan biosynthesis protein
MTALRNFRHPVALALSLFAATVSMPAHPQGPTPGVFTHELVQRQASELAAKAYEPPPDHIAKGAENLDYDQYRQIRFRRERTIWRGEGLDFELQVLPIGWLFKTPVRSTSSTRAMSAPLLLTTVILISDRWLTSWRRRLASGSQGFASPVR